MSLSATTLPICGQETLVRAAALASWVIVEDCVRVVALPLLWDRFWSAVSMSSIFMAVRGRVRDGVGVDSSGIVGFARWVFGWRVVVCGC